MKLSTSNKKLKEELCTVKDQLLRQKDSIHTLKMKIKKKNGEIKENETNFLQLEDSYQNQVKHMFEELLCLSYYKNPVSNVGNTFILSSRTVNCLKMFLSFSFLY